MIFLTIHCLGIIVILFYFVGVVLDTKDVPVARADNVRKRCKPNRFDNIWHLLLGKKLFLEVNKASQPIGINARSWARWLGTLSRMSTMCPINYVHWPLVPQQYKNLCWAAVQVLD